MSKAESPLFKRRCCRECGTVVDSGEITVTRGNLTLDRALRRATWRGNPVALTPQQFDIVEFLVQRGRLVQRWAFFVDALDEELADNHLDVQVCKIRERFRRVDSAFNQLETVRGEGFRWRFDSLQPTH